MNKEQPKDFKGIRSINLPNRKSKSDDTTRFKEIDLVKKRKGGIKRFLGLVFILGIIASILTYFFYSASFQIKNSSKRINFNNQVFNSNIINPKPAEELSFDLMNIDLNFQEDLESQMIEDVKEKAKGKIKIINNTTKVQKLRKETRFEVDGKIFKTVKSVTIQPKSFVIKDAFADEAGAEFNLEKGLKMSIPGFKEVKDMDSYKKIVGEIAETFLGGFIGKKEIPSKKDLENKKKKLEKEIKSTVLVKIRNELPKDYILNNDGIFTTIVYKTIQTKEGLKLIAKANAKGIIYKKKDFLALVTGLPKSKIGDYNIESTAFLKFKIIDKDKLSVDSIKKFNFSLDGELAYKREFDKTEFLNLVQGKTKKELQMLIKKNYPEFDIEFSIFPFWMTKTPEDSSRLKIK